VRSFDDLVDEAEAVDVSGWDFSWLDGRASEQRPLWGYSRLVAVRLREVHTALDIDTGGGELVAEMPHLPNTIVVTEGMGPECRARATDAVTARSAGCRG
jgi:hypothetical protein